MQYLNAVLPETAFKIRLTTIPGLEFIARPIQNLFKDQPPKLTAILKIFSALAVRFRR